MGRQMMVRLAGVRDCGPYRLKGCVGCELWAVGRRADTKFESHQYIAAETTVEMSSPREEFDTWNALSGRQT